jgi:hypothetical protein
MANNTKPHDSIREICALCGRSDFKYRFSEDYFKEQIVVIQCADPKCNWLVGIVSATPDHQWYIARALEYKAKHGEGQVEQMGRVERMEQILATINPPTLPLAPEPSGQLSLF